MERMGEGSSTGTFANYPVHEACRHRRDLPTSATVQPSTAPWLEPGTQWLVGQVIKKLGLPLAALGASKMVAVITVNGHGKAMLYASCCGGDGGGPQHGAKNLCGSEAGNGGTRSGRSIAG